MQESRLRIAIVIGVVATSASAWADEPCKRQAAGVAAAGRDSSLTPPTEQAAVEHLEAGNRAFRVQHYDKAIEEYTAAGMATSAPLILYNLGQALRASKQYDKAIRQYQLFLSRGSPAKELREFVECVVGTMKGELEAAASTAPPTGPAPDGVSSDTTAGRPAEPASTARSSERRQSRWTGRRKIALVTASVSVATIGAGIAFGLRSKGFEDDAAALCPTGTCASDAEAARANSLVDRAESNATYANIAFGVGAAAVVGAVVLWVTGAPSSTEERTTAVVAPRVTKDAAGFVVRLRF